MKILFDYFDDTEVSDSMAHEMRHVLSMIEDGFTSGQLDAGEGAGWWSIEQV